MKPPATTPTREPLVESLLGTAPNCRSHTLTAITVTLAVHATVWCWAQHAQHFAQACPKPTPTRIEVELLDPQPVEVVNPPPRAADEKQLSEPPPTQPQSRPRSRAPRPTPAEAAEIVAQEPATNGPVDLTSETFVVGTAQTYAGGATSAAGTSHAPAQTPAADGSAQPPAPVAAAPDYSSPVTLAQNDWSCPWPHEADLEQIDEQIVVLRVLVDASGSPESAAILSDPGHGFGPAARDCALRTRFTPARDTNGNSVRASSPSIRVRFTR